MAAYGERAFPEGPTKRMIVQRALFPQLIFNRVLAYFVKGGVEAFHWVQIRICSGGPTPQFEVGRKMTPQTLASTVTTEVWYWIVAPECGLLVSWLDAVASRHTLI